MKKPKNPLDLHILRLIDLYKEDTIINITAKDLRKMTDGTKSVLLKDLNEFLGISPLLTDHLDYIDEGDDCGL